MSNILTKLDGNSQNPKGEKDEASGHVALGFCVCVLG